ncbi:hypothetical protein FDG2_5395 [Candidatus Protofrankia californiensis]|uniref:Uncharacterized protein n=1 Tax=Candidatus Protofrankia californiensis TaxID=1839754 RepID=A0A1C3PCZ3_9ACTN|nr:hypothetical protein FDG2_5395 [Candidatus Protofrankia californiensis]
MFQAAARAAAGLTDKPATTPKKGKKATEDASAGDKTEQAAESSTPEGQ